MSELSGVLDRYREWLERQPLSERTRREYAKLAPSVRGTRPVVLPVRERVSVAEHPDTLTARANLAYWTRQADNRAS